MKSGNVVMTKIFWIYVFAIFEVGVWYSSKISEYKGNNRESSKAVLKIGKILLGQANVF